jgi:hypothetical protein
MVEAIKLHSAICLRGIHRNVKLSLLMHCVCVCPFLSPSCKVTRLFVCGGFDSALYKIRFLATRQTSVLEGEVFISECPRRTAFQQWRHAVPGLPVLSLSSSLVESVSVPNMAAWIAGYWAVTECVSINVLVAIFTIMFAVPMVHDQCIIRL